MQYHTPAEPLFSSACEPGSLPHSMDFVAIDFETATGNRNSACAVGLAFVKDLKVTASLHQLIQPPGNQYDQGNINVHGIYPEDTEHAPFFPVVWEHLYPMIAGNVLIAHNAPFDMSVIKTTLTHYEDPDLDQHTDFSYVDSIAMAKDFVPGRKNLAACSSYFHIDLSHHHNAECDAIACAEVAIACIKAAGCRTLEEFCRVCPQVGFREIKDLTPPKKPLAFHRRPAGFRKTTSYPTIRPSEIVPQVSDFDPSHPFYQKSLVFTGDLSIDRREAMQQAVNTGAVLKSSVSRKTDFLVVGQQNRSPHPSGKEEKARALLAAGSSSIQIISETEFFRLLHRNTTSAASI